MSQPRSPRPADMPRYDEHTTARVIHPSLVRPLLYLGVERHVIALEATICLALIFGVGLTFPTLGLIAIVAAVIHPALVWVTARDPQATAIYARAQAYGDYYGPQGSVNGTVRAPRPSVPRIG